MFHILVILVNPCFFFKLFLVSPPTKGTLRKYASEQQVASLRQPFPFNILNIVSFSPGLKTVHAILWKTIKSFMLVLL